MPSPARMRSAGSPLGRRRAGLLAFVGAALGTLFTLNFVALRAAGGADTTAIFRVYPLFFALLFGLYLAGVSLSWSGGRRVALIILGAGLLFRLAMLPTPLVLSSDAYRYLWDGRVQLAGINPYRHPPHAEALASLRDAEIYPRINRPWAPTIYPPGAEALFAGLAWAAPGRILALRLLLIGCDLATMLLLLILLRRLGLPEGRIAVYAWAPLAIFEFAQAGHIDAALLPLVLAALLARMTKRPGLAGALLGGASLLKLSPAILLPVLWQRGTFRLPAVFLAVLALGYMPYAWGIGWKVTGFLPTYFARFEDFNVGLRSLLTEDIGLTSDSTRQAMMGILAVALGACLLAIARRRPDSPLGVTEAAGAAVGAYLLLVPATVHPWYVVWLVPFLAVMPGVGWWYFTGAVALSYLAYTVDPHRVPLWARCLEYVPTYLLVLLGLRSSGPRPAWSAFTALRSRVAP